MTEKDTEIFSLINKEKKRQQQGIELIASENFVSKQVMQAMGSVLQTNMLKDFPENATMEDVRLLTRSSSSPSTGRKFYSMPNG